MQHCSRLALLSLLAVAGCGGNDTPAAAPEAQHAPAGKPEDLPKVPADSGKIVAMLHDRFGDDVARNIRIEVEDQAGGKRVGMRGEVPNEEIRQAVMKEVEVRVEGMKNQDFTLDVAGPIRQIFGFDARISDNQGAVFSPDLSVTIAWNGDIFETATGRRINRITLPDNAELRCMAISPDGKLLATGFRKGALIVWQLPLGRAPKTLQATADLNFTQSISALQFTADSKHLVSVNSDRGVVSLWDVESGSAKTIGAHRPDRPGQPMSEPFQLAVSPDGRTIASAGFDEIEISLWDVDSRSKKQVLAEPRVHPEAIAWSHDGKTLAVARAVIDHHGVVLFDLPGKASRLLTTEQDRQVENIAFSPDDKTLAVSYHDDGLALWDVPAGKIWMQLDPKKTSSGSGLAFSPDGNVLASEGDTLVPAGIRLWDVSKRPGGGAGVAKLPHTFPNQLAQDDRFCSELTSKIRGTFDPSNVETLSVEKLPDGSIKLTGKVSDAEIKRVSGQEAQYFYVSDDIGDHEPNKVVNELQVTGRYVPRKPQ